MIEPIDFSGNDEEYLSSDLKQRVLAFSIIWGVLGFILSAWLFLGKKVGPASLILDRRLAEGRVVDASTHRSSTDYSSGGFSSRAPRALPYLPPERQPRDRFSNLARLEGSTSVSPSETTVQKKQPVQRPTVVELQAIVDTAKVPTRTVRTAGATRAPRRPTTPVASEQLDRLLYPAASTRPERSSLAAAGRQVERSLIRLSNVEGLYHVGLLLDNSGQALISDSSIADGSLDRVWVDGQLERARLLRRDAEYGIALIQLPEGSYGAGVPLSPVPPARGEELLAFGPSPSRCLPTVVRAGVGFGAAGFLLEGHLGSSTWGSPVLNDRGELVGCHFSSLPDFPGSGVHLAADSAAIHRLVRGYDSSAGSAHEVMGGEAYARLSRLAAESRQEGGIQNGRILPMVGVSQFFLGMSKEEASQSLSSPRRSTSVAGVETWTSEAPPVQLVFYDDRLVAVATNFSGFSTVTGLSMGATVDRQTLSRSYERFLLSDGLAMLPGLDILLDGERKARQFVVRPEL